ncbi:MAG TPA: CHASE3 domain-containing protein [Chloroflexia bacterium]|nr:CHASE3 domain-containing protein [Chloroflexia bacterium]
MPQTRFPRLALVGALTAILLLVLAGALAYASALANSRASQDETLLLALDASLVAVENAETGQRGYLITGDDTYLAPYTSGVQALQATLDQLQLLTAADPDQTARLGRLRTATDDELQDLAATITLRRTQGFAAAQQAVAANHVDADMDIIVTTVAAMQQAENARLDRLGAASETGQHASLSVLGLLALFAVGLLGLTSLLLRRARHARDAAARALQEREASFRLLFASSPLPMWVYACDTLQFLEVNEAAIAQYGYPRAEFLTLRITDIRPPASAARLLAEIAAPRSDLQTGSRWQHRRQDGQLLEVQIASHTLPFAGRPAVLVVAEDITAQVRTEAALQASEERYRSVIAALDEGILLLDAQGVIQTCNASAERILGLPARDLLGRALDDPRWAAIHEDGTPFPWETFPALVALQTGQAQAPVLMGLPAPAGPLTWVSATAHPLRSPGQMQPEAVVVSFADITERRQMEQARRSQAVAEAANQAKSEFLSRMSHELRTPLSAILGFGQLLEQETPTPAQEESITYIMRAGRHLLQLINEVLDISRIETGHLSLSPEPVPLAAVLAESLDLIRPLAAPRQVQLQVEAWPPADYHVWADQQRLIQVLLNLLSNAIKYNREGGAVTVSASEILPDRVRIMVRDTGSGMPAEHLARLFTPFERLAAPQTGVEGTGLGLALSQRLMEAQGSRIEVDSTPGVGSAFWIDLPRVADPAGQPPRPAAPAAEAVPADGGATLLYIEDNLSNLRLIERLLQQRPTLRLLPAMQGTLGLDLAREHQPDLILLDLHLPDLSGEEVLARLQADARTASIPVVVLSADATPQRIQRLLAAGARAYLTKPIMIAEFWQVLDAALAPG